MTDVMVSVLCITYNHEPYIRQALDSFVMQKTDFRFEVLVHDDASTDKTADVIREYAEKYPDLIVPIIEKENLHQQHKTAWAENADYVKGKYVALCEGDDFWTDELKLQKQFDAMENRTECSMCVHSVGVVKENGELLDEVFPQPYLEVAEGIFSTEQFLSILSKAVNATPFRYSSYFFKAEDYLGFVKNPPQFRKVADVGDMPLLMYFGQLGSVCYISDIMSCYRRGAVGSWSEGMRDKRDRLVAHRLCMIKSVEEFNIFTNRRYEAICSQMIDSRRFVLARETDDYKTMVKKQYRKYFKTLNDKYRMWIYLYLISPKFLRGALIKLRDRLF